MDIIRAYADKAASYLPKNIRQDTADELYDSLSEQLEEAEQSSDFTAMDLITKQPHPIRMATQMSDSEQLHLIGPVYYLSFVEALKVAAIVIAVIHAGLFGLEAWGSDNLIQAFVKILSNFPGVYFDAVAIIGLIFVAIEKTGQRAKWLDKWKVNDLIRESQNQKISTFESIFEMNIAAIVMLWMGGFIKLPFMLHQDNGWVADIAAQIPNLIIVFIFILLAFDILMSAIKLLYRVWSPQLRIVNLISNAAWVIILTLLIQIDPLFTTESFTNVLKVDDLLLAINTGVNISLAIGIAIICWDSVMHIYRLLKN